MKEKMKYGAYSISLHEKAPASAGSTVKRYEQQCFKIMKN